MTDPINRREFAHLGCAGMAAAWLTAGGRVMADGGKEEYCPDRAPLVTGRKLRVQPVFMYTTFQRRDAASWRSWSRINTEQSAAEEEGRIRGELAALARTTDLPTEMLPLRTVTSVEQAATVHTTPHDVVLLYPATGSRSLLTACLATGAARDTLIFVRHRSGPVYYWYEALSTSFLAKGDRDDFAHCSADDHGPVTVDDVVVDAYDQLLWRLRALYAIRNLVGHRIVALGGAQGKYDSAAPDVAKDRYRMEIADVSYEDLDRRLAAARADRQLLRRVATWTERYLAIPGTSLQTDRSFISNAFLLYTIFKDWMREHETSSITINQCMGTIIPMSQTTACLTLSWLNDEGFLAFCESDFVIIPPGIFLHYLSGKPVFLHNSTFPHQGLVTCAHCTAPRRMDGKKYEPAKIMTHYESDFGAAPKVELPLGRQVTFLDPEYSSPRWLAFTGIIHGNPAYEICRSQQDVMIQGDWTKLIREARDSHWMMAYGDHVEPARYAARKIGICVDELG